MQGSEWLMPRKIWGGHASGGGSTYERKLGSLDEGFRQCGTLSAAVEWPKKGVGRMEEWHGMSWCMMSPSDSNICLMQSQQSTKVKVRWLSWADPSWSAHCHSILTCWPRKSLMILPPSWYTCDLHGLGSLPFQNCRFSVSPSSCVTRRIFGKEGVFRDNDPSNVLVMWWLLLDLVFSLVKWSKAKLDGMKSSAGHIVQKQAELAVPRCKWCINSRLCVRVQAFWRHARS